MLINLRKLFKKYRLKIKGIIHVGAHECEELNCYKKLRVKNVHWVEAMKVKVDNMKNIHPGINIYNAVISDVDNKEVTFNITNNGQSSSILELGTHKEKHPEIHYIRHEKHLTQTLTTLIDKNNIDINSINFLTLDIQGNELRALKGLEKYIDNIDYIYTEVNTDYLYVDCNLLHEIDEYLEKFNFKRVEIYIVGDKCWGDAFYVRNSLLN